MIIGTPDHWHCLPTIYACQAGKDVYVEKPLSNTIEECNLMEKAARKYNRIVQVGQWQRSDPHWDEAANYLKAGNIGRIRTVKYGLTRMANPPCPSFPTALFPPEWITTCGWARLRNVRSTPTVSIIISASSGIMPAA